MNKRQRKKYIHKMCVKYQDGYGLMSMLRNPFITSNNIRYLKGKVFNEHILLQYDTLNGVDFSPELLQ